jgi:hypothetical protein
VPPPTPKYLAFSGGGRTLGSDAASTSAVRTFTRNNNDKALVVNLIIFTHIRDPGGHSQNAIVESDRTFALLYPRMLFVANFYQCLTACLLWSTGARPIIPSLLLSVYVNTKIIVTEESIRNITTNNPKIGRMQYYRGIIFVYVVLIQRQ